MMFHKRDNVNDILNIENVVAEENESQYGRKYVI